MVVVGGGKGGVAGQVLGEAELAVAIGRELGWRAHHCSPRRLGEAHELVGAADRGSGSAAGRDAGRMVGGGDGAE